MYRPCGNTFDADRKLPCIRTTYKQIPPGILPIFGKAPRRIFVYIAVILVYKATDTAADTERHEERHTAMCGFLYGVLRLCLSWARYSAGVMPYSARKLFKKLL